MGQSQSQSLAARLLHVNGATGHISLKSTAALKYKYKKKL